VKIESTQGGGIVSIGDERAKRLLQSRDWKRVTVDSPVVPEPEFDDVAVPASQEPADDVNGNSEGDDTQEEDSEPETASEDPSAADVRAWAKANTDIRVPARGRVPAEAYIAYTEAHKNN
jgi:hypothetical protein